MENPLELFPLRVSSIIRPGDSIPDKFIVALGRSGQRIRNGDVVAVASKVVAVAESMLKPLDNVRPTKQASRLARRYSLTPRFAQAVIDEADEIYGGVNGALLTLKNGEATANAGIDQKNAPKNMLVLWPTNPDASARGIRESLERRFHKKIGVVIVDSRVAPMRLGTVGVALGSSGIETVADLRGKRETCMAGEPALPFTRWQTTLRAPPTWLWERGLKRFPSYW